MPTDTINSNCSACGATIRIPTNRIGKIGACPRCKRDLLLQANTSHPALEVEILSEPEADSGAPLQLSPVRSLNELAKAANEQTELLTKIDDRLSKIGMHVGFWSFLFFVGLLLYVLFGLGSAR